MTKSFKLAVTLALGCAALSAPAHAADWPTQEIVFIVPYAAGGPTDILARLVGDKLQQSLGQPVIIENKAGGNGSIGAVLAAKAAPDGHTIYLGGISTMSVAPSLSKTLPYDPVADFEPVSLLSKQSILLMASPNFAPQNLEDFIAEAKKGALAVNYATSGNGTSGHMAAELFQIATETELNHIPYKGSAPALNDLMGGQVHAMFGTMLAAVPNVRAGSIKAIAVSGTDRSPVLPDVPTFREQGLSEFEPGSWNAIFVPKGTPEPIIEKLNGAIKQAVESPELVSKLAADGSIPVWSTPEELAQHIQDEQKKWKAVVDKAGLREE